MKKLLTFLVIVLYAVVLIAPVCPLIAAMAGTGGGVATTGHITTTGKEIDSNDMPL